MTADSTELDQKVTTTQNSVKGVLSSATLFPTVFVAIRTEDAITAYSNIAASQVTIMQAPSASGRQIRSKLNFISLITEWDERQHLPPISISDVVQCEKPHKVRQTNLGSEFIPAAAFCNRVASACPRVPFKP